MKSPERDYEIADMEWAEAKAEASLLGMRTGDYLWGHLKRGERMGTLMELSGSYRLLLDAMEDADPDETRTFEDTLESVMAEVGDKADSYAVVIREASATAEKFRNEAARLTARAETVEANVKRMKDRLKAAMQEMGTTKLEGEYHRFRVQKNGGKQPMEITGEVPDRYKKIVYEPDTARIRADLESGMALGFAHLEERGTHLRMD